MSLSNKSIEEFAVAWRRAIRRVCAYLLARIVIFCHCLMNLCLSLLMFVRDLLVLFCLKSKSKVVRSVASFGVLFGSHESITWSNAIYCCSQFNWNFSDFFLSTVDTRNKVLCNNYLHDADDSDRHSATLLAELISVRDGLSDISFFSDGSMFAYDDVCDLISHFALS